MQRNFLRGLLICLVPCVVAGYYAARLDKYKLGIDLAGGTILVYEINLERTKQLEDARAAQGETPAARRGRQSTSAAGGLSSEDMLKLASQIKKRIDPADLKNVTVRPLGDSRVEIILPTGGAGGTGKSNLSEEEIEEVKRLVSQMGVLEFRILANDTDDKDGVQAAMDLVNTAAQSELDARAARGQSPEGPAEAFTVKVNDVEEKGVRYVWVELGAEERETLGLNNASEGTSPMWLRAAGSRNRAFVHQYGNEGKQASMVLFSREVKSPVWLEKETRDKDRLEKEGKGGDFNPKKVEYFVLTRVSPADTVKVEGDISLTAQSDTDPKTFNPSVSFRFNGAGANAFGKMTERNKPSGNTIRTLAILLDDKIVSAPTLNAVITSAGQITGKFDRKSVDRLVNFLRNGALNAQLREKPVSENTIGPTLGADTIRKGTIAVGAAFAVVLVFMLFYYRFAGMVACVALLANLILTVGFMVGVNAAFTLPGLAGIVLMLGMAVDANVLIYERLREERNKGANLVTAIRNGYDRAFPTIIDTHLTSIFTAIVLYTFGNDQLKGFAISLTVGLIISLFTSLYMTRLMFDFWLHKKWLHEMKMLRIFERPSFNPMKYRFYFFTITTILTIAGLAVFLVRGESGLNVDFRGGTVYAGKLRAGEERALTTTPDGKAGLRDLLDEKNQEKRLDAKSARLVNKPPGADAAAVAALGTYDYEITYADGSTTTVTLTQKPAGDDEAAMEANVVDRARHLRDVSVEQMFLSGETYPDNKSKFFTIRTTEKQPELVRVNLDRLLRDEKNLPLVASTVMTPAAVTGPVVELTFDSETSPSMIRDLLDREFKKENAADGVNTFDLRTPPAEEGTGGRFKKMWLDVSKNAKFAALKKSGQAADAGGPAGAAAVGWPAALAGTAALADPDLKGQTATLAEILTKTRTAFETRPIPERLGVFDSTLAAETRNKALYAIVASWTAILLYLWFRFGNWTFGLAAVLCLIHDLCFTLGCIAAAHYLHELPGVASVLGIQDFKIDLATIAALLTLVGYSVSDTIVVFDRIREVRGKNPALTAQMINDSVNQTLSRTTLAAATVFLVSIVLYLAGGEGVHLFAFVMVVGVLVGTYSSIFVAAPLLLMFGEGYATGEEVGTTADADAPPTEEESVVEG